MKKCISCGEPKPPSDFYTRVDGQEFPRCKECLRSVLSFRGDGMERINAHWRRDAERRRGYEQNVKMIIERLEPYVKR